MRPGIAEYTQRQRMILREETLGPQGRRHGEIPRFRKAPQETGPLGVFHPRSGKQDNPDGRSARCLAGQVGKRSLRCGQGEQGRMGNGGIDLSVLRIEFADLCVAGQGEMYGSLRLPLHLQQRMADEMAQIPGIIDRTGISCQGLHHLHIIQRLVAGILEEPHSLRVRGDFTAQEQDGRAIGGGCRNGRDRIAKTGTADAERRAEFAARPCITVGHVSRPSLLGGHNGPNEGLPPERRKERIDQPARHHEEMINFLNGQRIQNEISA